MPRPRRPRFIGFWPPALLFTPGHALGGEAGRSADGGEGVALSVEELEALRLADLEGQDQAECALELGVSQSTIQRTLQAARHKVAEALVQGRPLRIEMGGAGIALLRDQLALVQAQVEYLQAWLEEIEESSGSDS